MTKKYILYSYKPPLKSYPTKLRVGDPVYVITGSDKGKTGKILSIDRLSNRAVVEDINLKKKHKKASKMDDSSSIKEINAPINLSNIAYYDEKQKKPVKLKYTEVEGQKRRMIKSMDNIENIDQLIEHKPPVSTKDKK